eukprot:5091295-Amphidinium_carterae.1
MKRRVRMRLTPEGVNFDNVNESDVEVTIGGFVCAITTMSDTEIECTVPTTPHARLNLKVRLAWKGLRGHQLATPPPTSKTWGQTSVLAWKCVE